MNSDANDKGEMTSENFGNASRRGKAREVELAVAKCTLGHVMGKGQWLSEAYTMSNYTLYSIGLRPDD
jgi:hypothetical protein